jgi:peptide/nickel transport system ATP-binding protein
MTDSILEVHDLHKDFGDFTAVDGVSFDLPDGGALGLVGESGSGKTTIARIIVGLERATSGRVVCGGTDRSQPARSTGERRRRGAEAQIVFQDPYSSLPPYQTVQAGLDEVLRLHGGRSSAERHARVHELSQLVALDARQLRALPGALSGGQRQRVAIARALAPQPRLIILDEAVAALDVSIQAQILNLLADIRERTGVSYLFISHDLAVVRQVTDHAIVLKQGRIVERAPTPRLLDHPQDPYTQLLRASVPRPGWKPSRRRLALDEHGASAPAD